MILIYTFVRLNQKLVGSLRNFSIQFAGLKEGKHEFEFELNDAFFANFSESEIHRASLNASILLERKVNFMELSISITGSAEVVCDRCLETFNLPIDSINKLFVRFDEKTHEQSDEVLVIGRGENEIRLEQYLYEYVHLALPYRKVHEMVEGGSCNREMLNRLNKVQINEQMNNATDPRWDQLKKLIQKK